jgi:hypothetical protein
VLTFRAGLDARDGVAGLCVPEGRRAADMLRDALMVTLSVTRRAGIMIGLFLLYFTNSY